MTEQFVLDERVGDGRAVDGDERPIATGRKLMDGAREQLLACPRLALQQYSRIRGRDTLDGLRNIDDGARLTDDRRQAVALLKLFLEEQVLVPHLANLAATAKQQKQVIDVDRLLDEIVGTQFHGFDRALDRAERGHHNHRTVRIAFLRLAQHRNAIRAGKAKVREHGEVAPTFGKPPHRFVAVGADIRLESLGLDRLAQHLGKRLLVLDDEQPFHRPNQARMRERIVCCSSSEVSARSASMWRRRSIALEEKATARSG